jgi:hypothetical protein
MELTSAIRSPFLCGRILVGKSLFYRLDKVLTYSEFRLERRKYSRFVSLPNAAGMEPAPGFTRNLTISLVTRPFLTVTYFQSEMGRFTLQFSTVVPANSSMRPRSVSQSATRPAGSGMAAVLAHDGEAADRAPPALTDPRPPSKKSAAQGRMKADVVRIRADALRRASGSRPLVPIPRRRASL